MKKLILIIILLQSSNYLSQTNQECIDSLYSQDYLTKLFAVECVNELEIQDALSVLNNLLETQPPTLQIKFLNALYTLNDPDIQTKAHELISRADDFDEDPEYPYDPLEAKLFATAILVYTGDFSTIDYVFEQLNQDEITIEDALALHLLPYIMDSVSSYIEESEEILLNELDNSSEDIRYYALSYLAEEFGEEINDELVDKFENDSDLPIKVKALEHLCKNNYNSLDSLLKEQLILEEEYSLRIDIADSLLNIFGKPWDLKYVKDYQPNEPDTTAKSLINFAILEFIPPEPDSTVTPYQMSVNLLVYNDSLYTYGWITTQSIYNNYKTKLLDIQRYIEEGPISGAITRINSMLTLIYKHNGEVITNEAYVFLYYHLTYLKDRLE